MQKFLIFVYIFSSSLALSQEKSGYNFEVDVSQTNYKFRAKPGKKLEVPINGINIGISSGADQLPDRLRWLVKLGYGSYIGSVNGLEELNRSTLQGMLRYTSSIGSLRYYGAVGLNFAYFQGKGSFIWQQNDLPTRMFLMDQGRQDLISDGAEKEYYSFGAIFNLGILVNIFEKNDLYFEYSLSEERLLASDPIYELGTELKDKKETYFPSTNIALGFKFEI